MEPFFVKNSVKCTRTQTLPSAPGYMATQREANQTSPLCAPSPLALLTHRAQIIFHNPESRKASEELLRGRFSYATNSFAARAPTPKAQNTLACMRGARRTTDADRLSNMEQNSLPEKNPDPRIRRTQTWTREQNREEKVNKPVRKRIRANIPNGTPKSLTTVGEAKRKGTRRDTR